MNKFIIMLGATIGGIVGGYIPLLWGSDVLSGWSILLGAIGAFVGIWAGVKVNSYLE